MSATAPLFLETAGVVSAVLRPVDETVRETPIMSAPTVETAQKAEQINRNIPVGKTDPGSASGQRYYGASELDRYPVPEQPVNLYMVDGEGLPFRVRLLVRIDHIGRVVDFSILVADPPGIFGAAAGESLRATRFTPASKDGRPVKSRIILELQGTPATQRPD